MTELLLIYVGLLAVVWIIFKLLKRPYNPFKNIYFWTIFILSTVGVTVFLGYWFTRNFFGAPPEDGWNRKFYENGSLQTEFFASNGKIDGYFKSYYPNGQLEFLLKYKHGFQVDTSYTFFEDGKISNLEVFNNDKLIREIKYYPNGIKKSELYNPIDSLEENFHITYYSNGNKKFETRIDNKGFEGIGIYYYLNGKAKLTGQYKQGQENGVWVKLDSLSGKIVDTDTFDFKKDRPFKSSW